MQRGVQATYHSEAAGVNLGPQQRPIGAEPRRISSGQQRAQVEPLRKRSKAGSVDVGLVLDEASRSITPRPSTLKKAHVHSSWSSIARTLNSEYRS
jgi:hypothetical protein